MARAHRRLLNVAWGVVVGVTVLTTSVCGSAGDGNRDAQTAATTASPAASTDTRPAATLGETCPLVWQALPHGFRHPAAKWRAAQEQVEELAAAGDVETRSALGGLVFALDRLSSTAAQGGQPWMNARQDFLIVLSNLAMRCQLAGSQ
jgi:hypothetical protein